MCGIAGIVRHGAPVDRSPLDGMLRAIAHRGPDDVGTWASAHAAVGNVRLSIIDPAGGHQPIANEDGTIVAVCNGEIYNYRELTADLRRRGHRFTTSSDTEVLVHLYEERGDALVHDLRGMFAFAIWDARADRLLLVRDRLGIKPLYTAVVDGTFLFGSEIKALVTWPRLRARVRPEGLVELLTLKYVPAPGTLFDGVDAVPPGHLVVVDRYGCTTSRWWDVTFRVDDSLPDEQEVVDRIRDALVDAVRSHLVSDVPYGAFLSGGLDSSTVVAIMSRLLSAPVRTFAVGYDGPEAAVSELPYARLVAEHCGTEHTELVVGARDLVDNLPRLVWHLDQPIADEAALPNLLLADVASRSVKMVLTGEGGDELFAGYARYAGERLAPIASAMPAPVRDLAVAGTSRLPGLRRPKLAVRALAEPDEVRRFVRWFPLTNDGVLAGLLGPSLHAIADRHPAERAFAEQLRHVRSADPLSRMLYVDTKLWLVDDLLARGDKTSMAASLEARVPLLDHHLVELAASLPPALKLRGRTRKYALRRAAEPWLPAAILERRKRGFTTPMGMWFRSGANEFLRSHLTRSTVARRGHFDPDAVERLISEHECGADHTSLLFALLSIELWETAFLDASMSAGVTT